MTKNKLEITIGNESIIAQYDSIIMCNRSIADKILCGSIKLDINRSYVIMTNNDLEDDDLYVIDDASISSVIAKYNIK